MEPIRLGLIGCGTVGTGVARLLLQQHELLLARVGIPLHLARVADLDTTLDRGLHFEPNIFTTDAWQIVNDPQIDIVIEMIGGETLAKDLIVAAIGNGKHVVTANKALLARHGNQLFETAAQRGVDLAFEASVCGCMPIIKTLREALVANRIGAMIGILNGTSNYILSKISAEQIPFETALAEAQANGYAEADPTLDIQGFDAAHKLAILTALAYGTPINFDDIYVEGITGITPLDIQLAAEFGYRIKLLAISKCQNGQIDVRVHPTMIPMDNILSNVSGTLNAITVSGHAVGDLFLSGHGAGMMPTASAVLSDIVDLARNIRHGSIGRIPLLGHRKPHSQPPLLKPLAENVMRYYFRFSALDKPGVLSAIAGILGKHGISIESVHQKGRKSSGTVPVVMMSHRVKESDVRNAFSEIKALDTVGAAPLLIRIEDDKPEA
jgi:homoserine dehydrogenase